MSTGSRAQVADILERIIAARRRALEQAKQTTPAAKLEERAAVAPPVRDFAAALTRDGLNVIAELKKASPSRGVLRADYNAAGDAEKGQHKSRFLDTPPVPLRGTRGGSE